MPASFQAVSDLVRAAGVAAIEKKVPRLGAALAFYTVFAIAPLFVIVLAIAAFWFGQEAAQRELFAQVHSLVGNEGGKAIEAIVAAANKPVAGIWATGGALLTLLVGATGVFVQLQDALNTIWNVQRLPGHGLRNFLKDRLRSFAIVLSIGFLLLVSLVLSAILSALGKFMSGLLPAQEMVWQIINWIVSFGVITFLFAMIFKILPDVKINWHDVWVGAALSALLFDMGKLLLGLYLGRSSVASAYGAAGSLVVVLLWVYYSAQILLFGGEVTHLYADRYGSRVRPVAGAKFVAGRKAV